MSAFKSNVTFGSGESPTAVKAATPKAAVAGRQVLKNAIVADTAPTVAPTEDTAGATPSSLNNVPEKGTTTGGTITGKVDRKFTKGKNERDLRFGSTDPGLFGSTFEATGKSMPKRGGAATTNTR